MLHVMRIGKRWTCCDTNVLSDDFAAELEFRLLVSERTNCTRVKMMVRAVFLSPSKAKHVMVVQRTYSKVKVGLPGLEPGTNGLKDRYSNQLS